MGGRPNPFAAARPANRTQQEQGNSPGSGRHMSLDAIMNVRPTLQALSPNPLSYCKGSNRAKLYKKKYAYGRSPSIGNGKQGSR